MIIYHIQYVVMFYDNDRLGYHMNYRIIVKQSRHRVLLLLLYVLPYYFILY